jgi:hypothetical protein
MTPPTPASAQPDAFPPPTPVVDDDDRLDIKDWIMRNIQLNDPIELRRNDLRGWAEAAGFADIDVRNLGDLTAWELRFNRGTNTECNTADEAEHWLGHIARGCECQIVPGQFVAIMDGDRIAARFRLQPRPPPAPA